MSYFWSGDVLDDFLVKGLNTKSWAGLFGVCLGLVSVAVLYEGLHVFKSFLLNRFIQTRKRIRASTEWGPGARIPSRTPSSSRQDNGSGDTGRGIRAPRSLLEETTETTTDAFVDLSTECSRRRCSGFLDLGASSILHSLYVSIGFSLMNAVMTFNVWVTGAICLGIGIGYFFFGNYRRSDNLMYPLEMESSSFDSDATTAPVRSGSSRDGTINSFHCRGGGGDAPAPGQSDWTPENEHSLSLEPSESSQLIVGAQVHAPRIISSSSNST